MTTLVEKGTVFNRLTIIKEIAQVSKRRRFLCKCDCGNKAEAALHNLKAGKVQSCGCLLKDDNHQFKHGLSRHPLYNIWKHMHGRCYDKKDKYYKDYGARGIKVCKKWYWDRSDLEYSGIKSFISWNESLPKEERWKPGLQIERVDVNKNYSTRNCKWIPAKEQAHNKTNSIYVRYKSKRVLLRTLWSKYKHETITYEAAKTRVKKGMKPMEAVSTPNKMPNSRGLFYRLADK